MHHGFICFEFLTIVSITSYILRLSSGSSLSSFSARSESCQSPAETANTGSTEIANLRPKEIANNPDWCVRFYGVGTSDEAGAFTLLVCRATVSSFLPRKLSPLILNTVASSKIRSSAQSRASSSLKLVRQWDGCLLLVKTMLKLPSLLYLRSIKSKNSRVFSLSNSQ